MDAKARTAIEAIETLKQFGLLQRLEDEIAESVFAELDFGQNDEVDARRVYEILEVYYRVNDTGFNDASKDGYLAHDWRYGHETDDIIAEFCEFAGKADWFKLECNEENGFLSMRDQHGQPLSIDGNDLAEIAKFFNLELEKEGENKRFYALDTESDQFAFIFLGRNEFETLAASGLLAFEQA